MRSNAGARAVSFGSCFPIGWDARRVGDGGFSTGACFWWGGRVDCAWVTADN